MREQPLSMHRELDFLAQALMLHAGDRYLGRTSRGRRGLFFRDNDHVVPCTAAASATNSSPALENRVFAAFVEAGYGEPVCSRPPASGMVRQCSSNGRRASASIGS